MIDIIRHGALASPSQVWEGLCRCVTLSGDSGWAYPILPSSVPWWFLGLARYRHGLSGDNAERKSVFPTELAAVVLDEIASSLRYS